MGKTHIIGVGLDLGGTYTGTFITSHPSDEAEHRDHSSAFTVVNSEKLSFSSKSRTAVRHRVRSYKGFDLRRRLLLLVAEYSWQFLRPRCSRCLRYWLCLRFLFSDGRQYRMGKRLSCKLRD